MPSLSFDPAKNLTLFFRTKATPLPQVLSFFDANGAPFDISSIGFQLKVKKSQNDAANVLTFGIGSGLTRSANILTIAPPVITIREATYYYQLEVTIGSSVYVWFCGSAIFHNGVFDGVQSTNNITIQNTGSLINVTISGGGSGGVAETFSATKTFSVAPVFNALPTGTAVSNLATASTLVARDANNRILAANVVDGYSTTATAAATTTLLANSNQLQQFTGITTQTVVLPVATTLTNGHSFRIVNTSTGIVTVNTSGGNTVKAMAAGSVLDVWCINTAGGTGLASWNWLFTAAINN